MRKFLIESGIVALSMMGPPLLSAQGKKEVHITGTDLGEGIHMLVGQGGNIGLSAGPDVVFMVDDQFAPLTPKSLAAVGKTSDEPIRFVHKTHWA